MPNSLIASWYDALVIKPSPSLLTALNQLTWGLSSNGIWTELDLFHPIGGLETDEQRLRPLITTSTTKTFTNVNSVTLDSTGATGNGTTSYINTNWNATTDGIKFIQNSASMGVYNRTNSTGDLYEIGAFVFVGNKNQYLASKNAANNQQVTINSVTNLNSATSDSLGLRSGVRTAVNARASYVNGVSIGSDAGAAGSIVTINTFLCGVNGDGALYKPSNRNISLLFLGSGAINQLTFYNHIQTYMTSRGISV